MKLKEKAIEETLNMFNELYSGIPYPKLGKSKIEFFVSKAVNIFERELYYAKKLKDGYDE